MKRRGRPPGPRPQPTKLKLLRGNPGQRKLPEREPVGTPGISDQPDWLEGEAALKWPIVCEQLADLGVLTHVDADVLTVYCVTWAEWKEAHQTIMRAGMLAQTPIKRVMVKQCRVCLGGRCLRG